ncbi:MAG: hydrogenase maturation nickel metallochaperone HypA [Proteobacteria bacterium]|nr:hydrogenase maturation nickel metallochaperone HypA [Pseudomonadota bacterium]
MHELPVINSILSVVLKHAEANQVQKVVTIYLQVGAMSDLEDTWMQQYFDHLSKGGVAEGAKLVIERMPVVMRCNSCGHSFEINIKDGTKPVCPSCSGEKHSLVSGREYIIKNMEVL